jgi:hypothetical protein
MGARTNFHFKTEQGVMTLYSHWGGDTKKQDLAVALQAATPRLQGDSGYALRIIISNIIRDEWAQETGYGIYLDDIGGEEQYEPITVDLTNNTVTDESGTHTIFDYIAYHTVLAV